MWAHSIKFTDINQVKKRFQDLGTFICDKLLRVIGLELQHAGMKSSAAALQVLLSCQLKKATTQNRSDTRMAVPTNTSLKTDFHVRVDVLERVGFPHFGVKLGKIPKHS